MFDYLINKITVLAPKDCDQDRLLPCFNIIGNSVFSSRRIEVISEFSREIIKNSHLRKDPACVALAFWLRKSNLVKIRDLAMRRYEQERDIVLVPAGRVFHIAPTNVDTMFVYSWALSYLVGNQNVIRLSARLNPVVSHLLALINQLMYAEEDLRVNNAFVSYERNDEVNERFSQWCSHRVVWGGNDTVRALRAIPLNPHASERSFASKYSWGIIDAVAYSHANESEITKLAELAYNDIYAFDQMACSSPHVIYWQGSAGLVREQSAKFDYALRRHAQTKSSVASVTHAVKRRNFAFSQAVSGGIVFDSTSSHLTSVFVEDIQFLSKDTCGAGYIQHVAVTDFLDICSAITDQDQTVTYYGVDEQRLLTLAHAYGARGVDRLVPIGQALDFEVNWDGYSLVQDYLRVVSVKKEK